MLPTSMLDMVARVVIIEISKLNTILMPINIKIMATPGVKKQNRFNPVAKKKYKDLRPNMAKILEVIIIKGSSKIAKIAGILSVAKIISLISIKIIAKNSGVARNLPCCMINRFF